MRKCIFFDRDGIVNQSPGPGRYVLDVAGFIIQPTFIEALRVVANQGYDAIVITNQQGIGKGLMSEGILSAIHDNMVRQVRAAGLDILAIYHCPHLAGEECSCRKPKPGMILQAAGDWDIDLEASWVVGDSFRDIDAGVSAGCKTILVNPDQYERATVCIGRVDDLPKALENLIM